MFLPGDSQEDTNGASSSHYLFFFFPGGSNHFNIREIKYQFLLNGVCFIRLQVAFVFPAHRPFFFKDSDFLIKYPLIHVKSLHSFPSMFLPGGSHGNALQVRHSSDFYLLRWFQIKLSC